jgi:hypothetical protein
MKKALVDICYREEMASRFKKYDVSIYNLLKEDRLLKKMNETMKGSRYPSNGVQMDNGEYVKYKKKFAVFAEVRTDLAFCFESLKIMSQKDLCTGLEWIKANFDRYGKFRTDNSYQKIPRDSARLAMLCLCTLINKDLSSTEASVEDILKKLMTIHESLKMLDPTDYHRA